MFQLKTYTEDSYSMYQISNQSFTSWLTICPERGGIITEFGAHGEEQLYFKKETLFDSNTNVRGGIPILFPISGKLADGKYEWEDKEYSMPNHGLARINPWEVVDTKVDENQASITIRFASNDKSKEFFPFDFDVLFTYVLKENQLIMEQEYHNQSDKPMPIYAGFHPYFQTNAETIAFETDIATYLDLKDGKEKAFTGLFKTDELNDSVILKATKQRKISMELDGKHIMMETGSEFPYTVLWTEKGNDFVCLEPWMAMPGELNRRKELPMIEGNGVLRTVVSFRIE